MITMTIMMKRVVFSLFGLFSFLSRSISISPEFLLDAGKCNCDSSVAIIVIISS